MLEPKYDDDFVKLWDFSVKQYGMIGRQCNKKLACYRTIAMLKLSSDDLRMICLSLKNQVQLHIAAKKKDEFIEGMPTFFNWINERGWESEIDHKTTDIHRPEEIQLIKKNPWRSKEQETLFKNKLKGLNKGV